MSGIDVNRLKSDLDFERSKRKSLSYELQQLKQENATLNSRLEKIKDFIKEWINNGIG